MPSEILIAESIGIIAFAMSGIFVAIKERLDFLGLFIASFLTALGGGITRDIIIGKAPISFTAFLPATLVLSVIVLTLVLKLHKKESLENHYLFILCDSIGLISFSITASILGIEAGFNFIGVMLLALITAVGGGVLRDILLNRVPLLLKSDFYGSIAMLLGLIIFLLGNFELINNITIIAVFIFGIILRLRAYHKKWQLPTL
jgi:uncharacterized membrane protein YeiH